MAVMALNHANACAHLHSKCVDIHSIVEQRVLSDKIEHP